MRGLGWIDYRAVKIKPITDREMKAMGTRIAKECPRLWQLISAKRYLVPKYRQGDYYSQELLDALLGFFITSYLSGQFGNNKKDGHPDPVLRAMYMSGAMALCEGRPMFFLERELGEALLRTQLPLDLSTDDIHWRRRCMRIMLPRDLITLERAGVKRSAMYLDIGKAIKGEWLQLTDSIENEARAFSVFRREGSSKRISVPLFSRDGMVVGTQLAPDAEGMPGENYATIRPFEGLKLNDIKVGGHFETGSVYDQNDDALLNVMDHLAINILLFMGSVPLEYDPSANEAPIRKMEVLRDGVRPGLWPAQFVGRSLYRPSKTTTLHATRQTGRHLAQHWAAGHWKRQPHGPRWAERKLIWIEPYQTGA